MLEESCFSTLVNGGATTKTEGQSVAKDERGTGWMIRTTISSGFIGGVFHLKGVEQPTQL